jgi:hypothetical protein
MKTSQIFKINYFLIFKTQHPNGHHCTILGMHMKSSTNTFAFTKPIMLKHGKYV